MQGLFVGEGGGLSVFKQIVHDRHSRVGGNLCFLRRKTQIPAFAGMTVYGEIGFLKNYIRANLIFSNIFSP